MNSLTFMMSVELESFPLYITSVILERAWSSKNHMVLFETGVPSIETKYSDYSISGIAVSDSNG